MSSLFGEKIFIPHAKDGIENIGAVKLYPHQENHYLDYFLLLLSFWEEMPTENQIKELRIFIKKYYIKEIHLNIFNAAVEKNKIYIKKYKERLNYILSK